MALSAGASYFGPSLGSPTLSTVLTRFGANGFGLACILFSFLATADAHQPHNEKLIKADDPVQITDAVMITNLAVAGKTVDCGLLIKPPAVV